jgi:hypothetical protein
MHAESEQGCLGFEDGYSFLFHSSVSSFRLKLLNFNVLSSLCFKSLFLEEAAGVERTNADSYKACGSFSVDRQF